MRAYLLLAVIAVAFTFLITPVVRRVALAKGILTPIRSRDVHRVPVARLGGIGMTLGFICTLLLACRMAYFEQFFDDPQAWALLIGAGAICMLGVIDDVFDLNWWTKLAGQILISGLVAWHGIQLISFPIFGMTIGSSRLSITVTVLVIVASINAVNFVDGLDGLAAGVVAIGSLAFFAYAYILIRLTGAQSYASFAAMMAIVLCGVCIGFLCLNFHPAKIFMGDSGSMFLGYVVACNAIVVTGQIDPSAFGHSQFLPAILPLLLPVAVMLLPIVDMTMAIIRRLKAGKSPFSPDRMHLHHRLLRMGHSHRRAVLILYFWAAGFSSLGIALITVEVKQVVISGILWVAVAILFSISFLPGLRNQVVHHAPGHYTTAGGTKATPVAPEQDSTDKPETFPVPSAVCTSPASSPSAVPLVQEAVNRE